MLSGNKTKKVDTKLSEKEQATKDGKPWVKVLDTNVDQDNPKYGYFELAEMIQIKKAARNRLRNLN